MPKVWHLKNDQKLWIYVNRSEQKVSTSHYYTYWHFVKFSVELDASQELFFSKYCWDCHGI